MRSQILERLGTWWDLPVKGRNQCLFLGVFLDIPLLLLQQSCVSPIFSLLLRHLLFQPANARRHVSSERPCQEERRRTLGTRVGFRCVQESSPTQ